jgi:hypothetical protein
MLLGAGIFVVLLIMLIARHSSDDRASGCFGVYLGSLFFVGALFLLFIAVRVGWAGG